MFPTTGPGGRGATPSRPSWWMFALAAAFVGYYALLVSSDLSRPESTGASLQVQGSSIIVRSVVPGSPAARAGIQAGDRLAASNGTPLRSHLDWLLIEINLSAGESLNVDVARNGVSNQRTIALGRASRRFWLTPAGGTLLVARAAQLVTLVLALVVAFKRPFDRAAQMGAWVLATIATYSIVLPYGIAATWRALPLAVGLPLWIPFASSVAIAAIIFSFFAIVPRPIIRSRRTWMAVWLPMVPVLWLQIRFTAHAVYFPNVPQQFLDWRAVTAVVTALYAVAALAALLVSYRNLIDVTEQRRLRVMVLGSITGLLGVLPVVSAYSLRSNAALGDSVFSSPWAALGAILGLALPASFAYAILRHRLFDVGLILRRGLQYALARRVLISIVPAMAAVFAADLWIHREIALVDILRARGWAYAGLAAFAVFARLRRDNWLDALDRKFFRERYKVERLLREINEDVRSAASVDLAAARTVAAVEASLHPEFVALQLRQPNDALCRVAAIAPPTALLDPLASASKIAGVLEWLQKPIQLDAADRAGLLRQLPVEELEWLRGARVALLVPLRSSRVAGVLDGVMVLGPKRSEEPYSAEDEDLLMAIADSLAVVFARDKPATGGRIFEECPECGVCYDEGTDACARDGAALVLTPLPRMLSGRYQLECRIGRGAMGTVYAAVDTALGRRVAVKLLREDLVEGRTAAQRFQSEARLAAGLTHPNVVTVHDIGMAGGRAFFIMELLEGETLRAALLRAGSLEPARALSVMRAICAAVEAAHGHQMIHRDLKPENIFLCASGVPKVLDFGLAKALESPGSALLTEIGTVAGTRPYMAPEHLRGEDASPDWDLWALGVIALEMVTGDLTVTPERLVGLPAAQRQFFTRALAPDPLDRPTSATQLLEQFDRALICNELQS
jgi:tRNA A-37 threonylcarbamoyl transferase component Bud32